MKVLVIGLGQIGYRHAQSLLTCKSNELSIVEPKVNKYCQDLIQNTYNGRIIEAVGSIDHLKQKRFDIALISTNSAPRMLLAEKVLNDLDLDILVLEKVVFQSLADFDKIIKLSDVKEVKVFVNLPLRTRSIMPLKGISKCSIRGKDWGLLCNSVHFIDYFICANESTSWRVMSASLEFVSNKRGQGYVEAIGDISLQDSAGFILELASSSQGKDEVEWIFDINGESNRLKQGEISSFFGLESSLSFYQSEITLDIFKDLFEGKPSLPNLTESLISHKLLFEAMDKAGYLSRNGAYEIT